jgi:acyl carrier protein
MNKYLKIISELTDQPVNMDTKFHDIKGFDELDKIELAMGLEDHFNKEIPDEVLAKAENLHHLHQYLSKGK